MSDRLREIAPWTDPERVEHNGRPVLSVRLSHAEFLLATNHRDTWMLETIGGPHAEQLAEYPTSRVPTLLPWDADVMPVADAVIAACTHHWRAITSSEEVSSAVKAQAAERLEAIRVTAAVDPDGRTP